MNSKKIQNRFLLLAALFMALETTSAALAGGYEDMGAYLSPAEKRGRDMWYKATMGNDRHHSYVLPQRYKAPIDFYKAFGAPSRGSRFKSYGLISDPDCKPATENSYEFDVCEGDETLLQFVGKEGYRDPACDYDNKEDSCLLAFGTSAGALGFRKFPNPRFKKENWKGWANFDPLDASVEPPFLFGTTCGSCHIGFDPNNPPKDPEAPKWENIRGAIGNVFLDNQLLFVSGLPEGSLLRETLAHVRPGTTDTSAVPHDQIHNTGTFNAVINFDKRPTFWHEVSRFRRNEVTNKWEYGTKREKVHHILKGGEDNVGIDLALERVYVNIGMCSEECWQNNLPLLTGFDKRSGEQRPFSVEQCRRDCKEWSAAEDRISDMISFLLTRRPTDLVDAKNEKGEPVGKNHLNEEKARLDPLYANEGGVMEAGRVVYAKNCASCHSSQKPTLPGQPADEAFFLSLNYHKKDANGVRIDWLGNDERTEVTKIDTNKCRSLHTNHGDGNIFAEFSSDTFKRTPAPEGILEIQNGEKNGRGYYRNISLLSAWAHAPFLHNNALGPEVCNANYKGSWECIEADPSVETRIERYEKSMQMLLNPSMRVEKISLTQNDLGLTLKVPFEGLKLPVQLNIPKGTPAALLGSLNIKRMVNDQLDQLQGKLSGIKNPIEIARILKDHLQPIVSNKDTLISTLSSYSNCQDLVENKGHNFGAELSDKEKTALIHFVKTL